MTLVADLIAAGEEVGGEALSALQAALGRESLAQHFKDVVDGVIAVTKRVEAIEEKASAALAPAAEATPEPVEPVVPAPVAAQPTIAELHAQIAKLQAQAAAQTTAESTSQAG